ncbi:hypothetical protein [Halobaculum sp. EA56]|uniref:hypothetical protein n=1 Tax=Halobaculum sp. EA56 TaxID=3421648 RepID=UPI003EB8F92B
MQLSDRGAAASGVGAVFVATAVALGGAGGWVRGLVPAGAAAGAGMLAVGVLATQRTMWVHGSPTGAGALSNAGLFLLAAAGKLAGVEFAVRALETAGEALFCIAVAYYLARAYG